MKKIALSFASSSLSFFFKAELLVAALFLLNFALWQPLHALSHLSSNILETFQIHEKKHEHVQFDLSDFSGCKTSLPSGKKYQWALESDCCSFARNFSEELLLQYDKQKKSLNINRKPFKIKYIGIELLNINQLIFEHFNRGPPTLLLQS